MRLHRPGGFEEIKPADLKGQIAVCEAAAGPQWINAFYFGAKR